MLSWDPVNSFIESENTDNQNIDSFSKLCSNLDTALTTFRCDASLHFINAGATWIDDDMEITAFISFVFLNLLPEQFFILKLIAHFDSDLVYNLYGIKLNGRKRGSVTELKIKLTSSSNFLNSKSDLALRIYKQTLPQTLPQTLTLESSASVFTQCDSKLFLKLSDSQIQKHSSRNNNSREITKHLILITPMK